MWRFAPLQNSRGGAWASIDWLCVSEGVWLYVSEGVWLRVFEGVWLRVSEGVWLCISSIDWLRVSESVRLCTINRNARGKRASTSRGDHWNGSQKGSRRRY
jgi:hypothetical protein